LLANNLGKKVSRRLSGLPADLRKVSDFPLNVSPKCREAEPRGGDEKLIPESQRLSAQQAAKPLTDSGDQKSSEIIFARR
jgi:hypothetical protein